MFKCERNNVLQTLDIFKGINPASIGFSSWINNCCQNNSMECKHQIMPWTDLTKYDQMFWRGRFAHIAFNRYKPPRCCFFLPSIGMDIWSNIYWNDISEAWVNNHILCFLYCVIVNPCFNFATGSVIPPLKVGHGTLKSHLTRNNCCCYLFMPNLRYTLSVKWISCTNTD